MNLDDPTLYSLLFAAVGALCIGFSIPLIRGRVPPNPFYGFRTRKALSDPAIWYPANRASGRVFLAVGVVVTAVSLLMLAFGRRLGTEWVVFTLVGVLALSIAALLVYSYRVLNKL